MPCRPRHNHRTRDTRLPFMNKRDFLKTSGILLSGATLSRFVSAEQSGQTAGPRTNWSGNLTYSTDHLSTPSSVEEVRQIVKRCDKLRALGARHSFNAIADSTANQISLAHFDEMTIDDKSRTVTVGAGVKYGQLAPYLDSHGYALHNLASLPHISVVGACSTGTHGSGIHNGNLSTAVSAIEFVNADGSLATLSRAKDGDTFSGAVVALGALGVITRITLNLLPTFTMRQVVYENLSFDQLEHNLDAIFGSGYSVSLFSDWQNHRATQVWIKSVVKPGEPANMPPEFYGAKLATHKLHPIAGHDATPCTEQMGIPGPWYERMPHFRMNFTPSSGAELQTGILRSAGAWLRSHSRRGEVSRPDHASSFCHGITHHRRRQLMDEHGLRAGLDGDSLHLETGVARGEGNSAADRKAACAL